MIRVGDGANSVLAGVIGSCEGVAGAAQAASTATIAIKPSHQQRFVDTVISRLLQI
jgi:hypothetical protein